MDVGYKEDERIVNSVDVEIYKKYMISIHYSALTWYDNINSSDRNDAKCIESAD